MSRAEKIRVVAAVVERHGRYLVCRRPVGKRHGGLWEFPGGKLDPGETLQAAVRRELDEELGVEVLSCGGQLFTIEDPGSSFVIEFHPVEIEGEPRCLEHSALAWVDVPGMLGMDLAPSDLRFAQFLRERR